MECRICGSKILEEQKVSVKDNLLPIVNLKPLPYREKEMVLYFCPKCLHRQIDYILDDTFYEEHDSSDDAFNQYFCNLSDWEKYINKISKYVSGKSILDVGCAQGNFLLKASRYFDECCGIEPSRTVYEKRFQHPKIKYVNDYFSPELSIQQYQVITSFQVMEHIQDLTGIIKAYKKYMADDGIGVINVPNGADIISKPVFPEIVMQHINYFSTNSLITLLMNNGFEILEVDNETEAYEITVYFRKIQKAKNICEYVAALRDSLNCELNKNNRIGVWGAEAKPPAICS